MARTAATRNTRPAARNRPATVDALNTDNGNVGPDRRENRDDGDNTTAATAAAESTGAESAEPESAATGADSAEPADSAEQLRGFRTESPRETAGRTKRGKLTKRERSKRAKEQWERRRAAENAGGGSSPGAAKKAAPIHLAGVETLLVSIHAMGAAIIGVPELRIDQKEAHVLGEAITKVAEFYPFVLDEKQMAWCNLGMVCAGLYGTRAMAWNNRMRAEKLAARGLPKAGQAGPGQAAASPAQGPAAGVNGAPMPYSHTSVPPVE